MKNIIKYFAIITLAMFSVQCTSSDDSNGKYVNPDTPDLSHPNDQYLYDNNGESLFEVYKTNCAYEKACAAPLLPAVTSLSMDLPIGPTETPNSAPFKHIGIKNEKNLCNNNIIFTN